MMAEIRIKIRYMHKSPSKDDDDGDEEKLDLIKRIFLYPLTIILL